MATAESVKNQLSALIGQANAVTGKEDTDLTAVILSLVYGFGKGGGLPEWISECEVQTFSPSEDTADPQTFSFSTLTKEPNIFIVTSNAVSGSYVMLDYLAAAWIKLHGSSVNKGVGYSVYARGPVASYGQSSSLVVASGTDFTVTPSTYGSYGTTFWRSKYTYTAIALTLSIGG